MRWRDGLDRWCTGEQLSMDGREEYGGTKENEEGVVER